MIRVGTMNESAKVNTYINPEDKVSLAQVKKSIRDYPVGTYLKYSTKGPINNISQYVYGLYKCDTDKWCPYSSVMGPKKDVTYTSAEVLQKLTASGTKNIGVKLSKSE